MKESKDEKMANREVNARSKGHPRTIEKTVKDNSRDIGEHLSDPANGLSKATELCRKHSERGEHAPMVGGHKMPY